VKAISGGIIARLSPFRSYADVAKLYLIPLKVNEFLCFTCKPEMQWSILKSIFQLQTTDIKEIRYGLKQTVLLV
jgi:hypothetical protein